MPYPFYLFSAGRPQDIFPYMNSIVLVEALAASDVMLTLIKAGDHYLLDQGSLDNVARSLACLLVKL